MSTTTQNPILMASDAPFASAQSIISTESLVRIAGGDAHMGEVVTLAEYVRRIAQEESQERAAR